MHARYKVTLWLHGGTALDALQSHHAAIKRCAQRQGAARQHSSEGRSSRRTRHEAMHVEERHHQQRAVRWLHLVCAGDVHKAAYSPRSASATSATSVIHSTPRKMLSSSTYIECCSAAPACMSMSSLVA